MPIFHCNVKTHSRTQDSANHAVRSAAYRAGTILVDEASGNTYNYSRKSEVTFSEIVVPANAPEWAKNRTLLWNNVEKAEKRVDAVLFREIEVALPKELSQEEYIEIIREYVQKTMTVYGIIVDYSIHDKEGNPHCHLMLTLRDITPEGFGNKNRDWNEKKLLYKWRQEWEKIVNAHLTKAGIEETIDCRSLKAQGVDRLPTVHEGREGIGGHNTAIVDQRRQRNRRVREHNGVRSELRNEQGKAAEVHASIKAIDEQIAELNKPEPIETPKARPAQLTSIRSLILKSVKPIAPSTCTAMMIYQAPRPKIGTIPGIDRSISLNLPSNPKEAARCYSLRALFGSKIDLEFNARLKAMQNIGKNYSWQAFYLDTQDTVDSKHGTNLTWWRSYTNMVYHEHLNKLADLNELAPKKYVNKLDEYVSTLLPGYTEKKEAPKIDTNVLDCFTKEELTNYKSKGVNQKLLIEYALQRHEYVGITTQVSILHRGVKRNIGSCKDFYEIHNSESFAEKAELDKQYWKSIDLKSYCLQLFDTGIALGFKPDKYDPFTIIRNQQRGLNPKDYAESLLGKMAKNPVKTTPAIRKILTGNSSMRDYADILSYSYGRNMMKGDFDNLIIPWWNQFVYADYYDEARRLAFENNIFLKFEKVTSERLQEAFNNKTPPIDIINSIAIGGTGGTGNGGYEYEEGYIPENPNAEEEPEPEPEPIDSDALKPASYFDPVNTMPYLKQVPNSNKTTKPSGYGGSSTPKPY